MIPVVVVREGERGALVPLEFGTPLPFEPRRVFTISGVQPDQTRGRHHTPCDEFLIAITPSCEIAVGKGADRTIYRLSTCDEGLYLPQGTYVELSNFQPEAVLLVACAEKYRPHARGD